MNDNPRTAAGGPCQRLRVVIRGAVQGVGFRPFVYRLAHELRLAGWVGNTGQGVLIEVEGWREGLEQLLLRLEREKPPNCFIQSLEPTILDPVGYAGFEIRPSLAGEKTALILPDIATCPECLREILDPANRRHRYPFTNCTHCGPRFTIIEALPYDRPATTMKGFKMCGECRREYEDPRDRRFHAQPNACPRCGPHLELWDPAGTALATHDEALRRAAEALRQGAVVAIKGIGGFHLMVDARDEAAVERLRALKAREEKPFALMAPTLEHVRAECKVSPLEERLLRSAEAPIVLLRRRRAATSALAAAVAPGNPRLGMMLPYAPLHHLLLAEFGFTVVATSGNLADEPIAIDEKEALTRLAALADFFLVHNRPIARHVDDSIVRVVMEREMVLRRARGYAPLPVMLREALPPVLAVGAHLKSTVALGVGRQVFISQHIGDLETKEARDAFERTVGDFRALYALTPVAVACDLHPGYASTRYARGLGLPVVAVQHHTAHVLACMAENEIEPPALGVAWDGTGYGPDGTVWGGEFLRIDDEGATRVAHLRTFALPGGEMAVREPRRSALGLLYEMMGEACFELADCATIKAFEARELKIMRRMLERGVNSPRTSSAGRLFDAVASLAGLRQVMRFEGQAAMELEFAIPESGSEGAGATALVSNDVYPFRMMGEMDRMDKMDDVEEAAREEAVVDWAPMVEALLADVRRGRALGDIAARFHHTLAEIILAEARRAGLERVVLSGGCFQNRYLLEQTVVRLRAARFKPYWHQRVPPNDGGIALGQVVAAARELSKIQDHSKRNGVA